MNEVYYEVWLAPDWKMCGDWQAHVIPKLDACEKIVDITEKADAFIPFLRLLYFRNDACNPLRFEQGHASTYASLSGGFVMKRVT